MTMAGTPSSSGFRLQLLSCPACGAPLAAEGEDVIFYCTACASGFRLGEGEGGESLLPVEVSFVALTGGVARRYLPFWLLPARLVVLERKAAGGLRGLMSFFLGEGDTPAAPAETVFAIPAFPTSLDRVTALARRYTEAFPRLGERLGERLTGGQLTPVDAEKLAHFTLIASEAEKPDTLQHLSYSLEFGTPRLLGVPFVERGGQLVDALFGLGA